MQTSTWRASCEHADTSWPRSGVRGAGVCSISEIAPTPRGTMDEFYRGEGAISALSLVEAIRQMKSIIHAGA
jgi:hypothetical protein